MSTNHSVNTFSGGGGGGGGGVESSCAISVLSQMEPVSANRPILRLHSLNSNSLSILVCGLINPYNLESHYNGTHYNK